MVAITRAFRIRLVAGSIAAAIIAAGGLVLADTGHGKGASIGEPGSPGKATRTVEITIRDTLYEPESIQVKAGETVRFVIRNTGELLHEFNIGTAAMHAEHQKEMAQMVEHGMLTATGINSQLMNMDHSKLGMAPMKHDDPNTVLIEPGKTAELVWRFSRNATLEYACNLPGHYDAGMVGQIRFRN